MKNFLFCATAAIFLLSCNNDKKEDKSSTADTTKTAKTDTAAVVATTTAPPDSAAMMKAWEGYMTPGEAHKMLAAANGKWNEETSMYMSPGAPPDVMKGTCENSMIMNGLYQRSLHHGSYHGSPFEGQSTMGYNNATKKYQSTWIDNMGSGMMNMEGTYDSTAKTYNMTGTETDMMTGKEMPVRETLKIIDDKNHYMEMFETRDGKESKVMDIKLTKQ